MSDLKKFLKGASWMGFLRFLTRVITFAKIFILARIFTPYEIGLFSAAGLVFSTLDIFSSFGPDVILIQKRKVSKSLLDSIFVVLFLRGLLLGILIFSLSQTFSNFFAMKELKSLIVLISFLPVVRGLVNPAIVKFQKRLQFEKEFLLRFSIFISEFLFTITFTILIRKVYVLVLGMVFGAFLEAAFSHLFINPRPSFRLVKKDFTYIIKRGGWITLYTIFNYSFENIDDIVVGKMLGGKFLGLYQMGYKIATLPITEVTDVFGKVSFPFLSKLRGEKIKKNLIRFLILEILLSFLISLLIFLYPHIIVKFFLGEKWSEVSSLLKIMAVFGFLRACLLSGYPAFFAFKNQEYATFLSFLTTFFMAVSIIPLISKYKVNGAVYSTSISIIFTFPFYIFFLLKTFRK